MWASGASTKGRLAQRRRELALYEQVLPSLELKRQQLLAERFRALRDLASGRAALDVMRRDAAARLPMLANDEIALAGLARVEAVESSLAHVLGTPVPVLAAVRWADARYGLLAKPPWVDSALDEVRALVRQRLEIAFAEERVRRLDAAIRKVVQRVNLFQKVLVPGARAEIQRIRIALADAERAAVVRSKIFKARHAHAGGVHP